MDPSKTTIHITDKGLALLAAIEVGWCPKNDNGSRDISTFNRFWDTYQQSLPEESQDPVYQLLAVIREDRVHERRCREQQRKDEVLVLRFIAAMLLIFAALSRFIGV